MYQPYGRKPLEVVTDPDGTMETCTVTDDDHAQTIIRLEPPTHHQP